MLTRNLYQTLENWILHLLYNHTNYSIGRYANEDKIEKNPNSIRYVHSDDVYNYLTKKERIFENFDDDIITPNFDYANLDYLHLVKLFNENADENILKETDRD